ncbi:hypothetical protein Golomagni_03772 [Golovinomyces magnicellulatus]|nr:hypothetical protein Golomagni_03772 [Golovinomyces magnicellulatus]
MSGLQKSFAKFKLASFSTMKGFDEADEDGIQEHLELHAESNSPTRDDGSSSGSSISSNSTIKPAQHPESSARPEGHIEKKKYAILSWTSFFERELQIHSETESVQIIYHAYLTSPVGNAPLFVMHHGAGSSGLSFAQIALEIRKLLPSAGILSLDARGHGFTHISPPEKDLDLSLSTLSEDLILVINETKKMLKWPEMPPLILVGHSLGGAVITEIARTAKLEDKLICYVVIDVVEGSAIDALKSMQTYLSSRPTSFRSLESAVEWHVRTRTIRNLKSAQISVPALLKQREGSDLWTWRTDLAATEPYWESWFIGMSKKFLEGKASKLLMLAGTDRLDTELLIGQMQGKFALHIFPEAGHFIHEDLPGKAASILIDFFNRNDRSKLVLPPKVADLLRAGKKI